MQDQEKNNDQQEPLCDHKKRSSIALIQNSLQKKRMFALEPRLAPSIQAARLEKYFQALEETVEVTLTAKKYLIKENSNLKLKLNDESSKLKCYENLVDIFKRENENLVSKILQQNNELSDERKKVVELQIELLRNNVNADSRFKKSLNILEVEIENLKQKISLLEEENDSLRKSTKHDHNFLSTSLKSIKVAHSNPLVVIKPIDIIRANKFVSLKNKQLKNIKSTNEKKKVTIKEPEILPQTTIPMDSYKLVLNQEVDDFKDLAVKQEPIEIPENEESYNLSAKSENSEEEADESTNQQIVSPLKSPSSHSEVFLKIHGDRYEGILSNNIKYNKLLEFLEPHLNLLTERKTLPEEVIKSITGILLPPATRKHMDNLQNIIKPYMNTIICDINLKKQIHPELVEAPYMKKKRDIQIKIVEAVDHLCPKLSVLQNLTKSLAKSLTQEIFKQRNPKGKLICTTKQMIERCWIEIAKNVEQKRQESGMTGEDEVIENGETPALNQELKKRARASSLDNGFDHLQKKKRDA